MLEGMRLSPCLVRLVILFLSSLFISEPPLLITPFCPQTLHDCVALQHHTLEAPGLSRAVQFRQVMT